MLRLLAEIQQFRDFALHGKRQFVRLNDSIQFIGRARSLRELLVESLDVVELLALQTRVRGGLEIWQKAFVGYSRALIMSRQNALP